MMEIQGKYGTAKVFTDVIDQPSISQILESEKFSGVFTLILMWS